MRFRVTSIRPGYCEVFANRYDGGRYERIAYVKRLDNCWHWVAVDYFILPEENFLVQSTRRKCIINCKKTALIRQMEHAIARQPKESEHWHSPRRDALADMQRSHLLTSNELEQWERKSRTFEEAV